MISAIHWVPAGVAAAVPKKYELSSAERELIELMEAHGNIDGDNGTVREQEGSSEDKKASAAKSLEEEGKFARAASDLPADLRMDEYSSDEDEEGMAVGQLLVGHVLEDIVPEDEEVEADEDEVGGDEVGGDGDDGKKEDSHDDDSARDSASSSDSDDDDDDDDLADVPDTRDYEPVDVEGLQAMGLSHVGTDFDMGDLEGEDDASDIEDVRLTGDDAVLVVAKTEDDFASLEVNVYDTNTGCIYVHHDIPLPSFPLCLAHGQVSGASTGNYCAVGTFSPGIEIWNLDVLNALEPSCTLGGEDTSTVDDIMKLKAMNGASGRQQKKQPRKKRNENGLRPGSHTDAVMSLSWNQIHKQVIASGSADCTVKLWDVTKADSESDSCNSATFTHHRGKVQSVSWHPKEGTLLATGSYDRTVALLDARSSGENVKKVKIGADCESIAWDPFNPEYLTVACEDGTVSCWDVRRFETSSPLWSFVANEFGGITDISYNNHVPGMLAMCSVDKTVSLWDIHGLTAPEAKRPHACGSKDMCSGKLYTVAFYQSDPWLLGCGGSGNQLALWNLSEEQAIRKRFEGRLDDSQGVPVENTEGSQEKETDFDAMMTGKEDAAETKSSDAHPKKKTGKSKRKGKLKVHRKGN